MQIKQIFLRYFCSFSCKIYYFYRLFVLFVFVCFVCLCSTHHQQLRLYGDKVTT